MHEEQRASESSGDVLASRARDRAERTGESFEEALGVAREEEALDRKRARELDRERAGERNRARIAAAWKPFIQAERQELELRKDGQLAKQLGDPLPGEPPEALRRLASEDRRQAEQGLVALTSNGKVFYKRVEELSPEDMPARGAAKRLRTTWLKERSDRWLGRGEVSP
ncbi:MAG: hypothetical protein M3151_07655 [Actinomycetota bacterium]|nr:hypothetical protein [Actinomycetota bacterium]